MCKRNVVKDKSLLNRLWSNFQVCVLALPLLVRFIRGAVIAESNLLAWLVEPVRFERLAPPRGNPLLLYLYGSLSCTCGDFRGVFWEESLLSECQRTSQVPPFRARVLLSFRTGEGRAQLYPSWGGGDSPGDNPTLTRVGGLSLGTTLAWGGGDSSGDNPTLRGVGRLSGRQPYSKGWRNCLQRSTSIWETRKRKRYKQKQKISTLHPPKKKLIKKN